MYAYRALALNDDTWLGRAVEQMNASIDSASRMGFYSLYGGLCGLGFAVEHISNRLPSVDAAGDGEDNSAGAEDDGEDLNADIDKIVLRELQKGRWQGPYDLIAGLVGMGVYFLERMPSEQAALGIELVLYHLEKAAERDGRQITWHTPPEHLPDWQRDTCPDGYYNLGLAHGIPGILQFLSESAAAGVDRDRASRLLEGGMQWFTAQESAPESLYRFGAWLAPKDVGGARLAWCYGDLGIASVMTQIACRSGRSDWQEFADRLVDHCVRWPAETAGVNDAPLCHGAAGVGHIFNRIYQLTREERCREAALAWMRRALAMRRTEGGVAGFFALFTPNPPLPAEWKAHPAFLDGAIGIALSLLGCLTPVEPAWDRLLMSSGRDWDKPIQAPQLRERGRGGDSGPAYPRIRGRTD